MPPTDLSGCSKARPQTNYHRKRRQPSRLCNEASSSSTDDADYGDLDGITFGNTCIYGVVPEPCVPSTEGSIIGS